MDPAGSQALPAQLVLLRSITPRSSHTAPMADRSPDADRVQ
jgi:hypothetical protein